MLVSLSSVIFTYIPTLHLEQDFLDVAVQSLVTDSAVSKLCRSFCVVPCEVSAACKCYLRPATFYPLVGAHRALSGKALKWADR